MRVTIFGGASSKPGTPAYQEAYHLGHALALRGHTVVTGGYVGTMEAASRGAREAGGHVVGITCAEIERFRPGAANRWVTEEVRFEHLTDRLAMLVATCDAAFALPGGVGTMAEISLMWNQLLVGALPPKPLILVGPGWHKFVDGLFQNLDGYIPAHDRDWLQFAGTIDQGLDLLLNWQPQRGYTHP